LNEPDLDYANPIEPAAHGGEKISQAIVEVFDGHEFEVPQAEIYVLGIRASSRVASALICIFCVFLHRLTVFCPEGCGTRTK
jgi:hypothetical protein